MTTPSRERRSSRPASLYRALMSVAAREALWQLR